MKVDKMPEWVTRSTFSSGTSLPPLWIACRACGGSGGQYQSVVWAFEPQWIVCPCCMGGGGNVAPR